MSTNNSVPPKFTPPVSSKLSPAEMAIHLRQLYLTVNQHDQAIQVVDGKTSGGLSTATFSAVAHQFLNGFSGTTFSAAQPAASDLTNGATGSGAVVLAQGPAIQYAYRAVTATYAVLTSDSQIDCTSGTFTVTLPSAAGITGLVLSVKNSGVGTITLATTSAQTIDGALTQTLASLVNMRVMSTGSNWIIV